jgi:hypothetical protein
MEKNCDIRCLKCNQVIDLSKDLFVYLGTYEGDHTIEEKYFHMLCWRHYFDEKARLKAEHVVNKMQEIMMPIGKQMTEKLKTAINQGSMNDDSKSSKLYKL